MRTVSLCEHETMSVSKSQDIKAGHEKSIVLIVGSTAVGKSKLAIDLARKIRGEVVSADSMQVYKFFLYILQGSFYCPLSFDFIYKKKFNLFNLVFFRG